MAKSKKKDKGGGLIILVILILGLAIIATPIVAVLGALFTLFSYLNKRRKVRGSFSDFWLNEQEKSEFETVANKLGEALENINKANKIGDSEGLARNKDGSFTLRGNRGKEVQGFINSNQSVVNKYNPIFQYLKSLPQDRWLKFRKNYTRFYGFFFAAIAWVISTYILISKNFAEISEGMSVILRFPADLIKMVASFFVGTEPSQNPDSLIQWKILLISAGICIVVFIIISLIAKVFVKKVSPIPPEVNVNNYDKY